MAWSRRYGRICKRKPRRMLSTENFGGYKTEVNRERVEKRERLTLRNKSQEEKHLKRFPRS